MVLPWAVNWSDTMTEKSLALHRANDWPIASRQIRDWRIEIRRSTMTHFGIGQLMPISTPFSDTAYRTRLRLTRSC